MIYHYTSIEALEKILKSKKIRFTRLDRVDDRLESEAFKRINFSKYLFISCWTNDQSESIPQWSMYATGMKGVRIGLPENMFRYKLIDAKNYPNEEYLGIKLLGSGNLLLGPEDIFHDEYEILPIYTEYDKFRKKVKYVSNIEVIKSIIEKISIDKDKIKIALTGDAFDHMVGYKDDHWIFQNELRFFLIALPSLKKPKEGYKDLKFAGDNVDYKIRCMLNGTPSPIEYLFLDLNEEVLSNIDITIGPLCNTDNIRNIHSIVEQKCKYPKIHLSELYGTIRQK